MDAKYFSKYSFVAMTGPGSIRLIALIVLLGIVTGLGAEFLLEGRLEIPIWLFTLGFIATNLVPGLLLAGLVNGFKVKWAYFAIMTNQLLLIMLTALFTVSSRITLFDTMVFWITMSYTIWLLTLSGLGAIKIGPKAILLSFIQPALVAAWMSVSVNMAAVNLVSPLILMAAGIVISTLIIVFTERIFSLVFTGMSGLTELSKFLKGIRGEQASLDIGHNIDALVQYAGFKTKESEHILLAPWLHSGPIRSVGGGNLSTQCIEKLNQKYADSYVFHVPSTHEYNPSTKVATRVVNSIAIDSFSPLKASSVVKAEADDITVMGQRLNDTYIVSVSSKRIDDYDISIFYALRAKYADKKIMFIDSHPNFPLEASFNVEPFTKDAEDIASLVGSVIYELDSAELFAAKVGMAVKELEQYSIFAMAVEADERYLYFAADTNGLSSTEVRSIEALAKSKGIKRVLFFSTDTHSMSIKALMSRPDTPMDAIKPLIDTAMKRMTPTEFGYGESLVKNVRIFGKTYYELVTLVKIMSRVIPVLFVLLFVFLAALLWIF